MKILMNRLLTVLNDEPYDSMDYYIGKVLLSNMKLIPSCSIVETAKMCSVSKSKLSNFIRKIGFEGYKDFRLEAAREQEMEVYELGNNISIADYMQYYGEDSYLKVLKRDIDLLHENLDRRKLKKLVSMIHDSNDLAAFGTGHSEAAALYLQASLGYLHKAVYTSLSDKKQEEYVLNAEEGALIIIYSNSGRYIHANQLREGLPLRDILHQSKAKIALITSNKRMDDDVDVCLSFPYSSNVQNHPVLFQMVSEYIVYEYQNLYGLEWE